jgi:hypothetical protein
MGVNEKSSRKAKVKQQMQWYHTDLHVHTPGSSDYAEPDVGYLDILQMAESKALDIIAFTDHNTIAGYSRMLAEIEELELLERLNRLRPHERKRLDEYRRVLKRVLVLPGFELTATLGFHILAIFDPKTSLRELEHILLHLNVPADRLDDGSTEVGATTDVLTAYRILDAAGALVIAAHANSTHGVALQGFDFGGQTKVAYTQDIHLHALEVTDLEGSRRRSTANFYNGSKPQYPRRMHCMQGSDAHRLTRDPVDKNRLGVGERVTEVLLPELSFQALRDVFLGTDFSRARPYRPTQAPFDFVREAQAQGESIVQSFHEGATSRGGRLHAVVCDIVAFANTNGGTIYIGVTSNSKVQATGVKNAEETVSLIKTEVQRRVTPGLDVSLDVLDSQGVKLVRISVPKGTDIPYAVDGTLIYLRQESETSIAVRDEIVNLVRGQIVESQKVQEKEAEVPVESVVESAGPGAIAEKKAAEGPTFRVEPPRTGVEILATDERKGTTYHTMKDLRNRSVIRDVTRSSARRLWRYAIIDREQSLPTSEEINWRGDIGLWKTYKWEGKQRHNLAQRDAEGQMHIYYGVTEDGIHGEWKQFFDEGE